MKVTLKPCPLCGDIPDEGAGLVWCNSCDVTTNLVSWNRLPRMIDFRTWIAWTEDVFWAVSPVLKHGGSLVPDLTRLQEFHDLWSTRNGIVGGDDLHCMREQIYVEYDIPTLFAKLWPL